MERKSNPEEAIEEIKETLKYIQIPSNIVIEYDMNELSITIIEVYKQLKKYKKVYQIVKDETNKLNRSYCEGVIYSNSYREGRNDRIVFKFVGNITYSKEVNDNIRVKFINQIQYIVNEAIDIMNKK